MFVFNLDYTWISNRYSFIFHWKMSKLKYRFIFLLQLFLRICDRSGFSLGPPVSSTNKTDRHDITEILLKVVLSTIKHQIYSFVYLFAVLNYLLFSRNYFVDILFWGGIYIFIWNYWYFIIHKMILYF
jgi:hypothetical protein